MNKNLLDEMQQQKRNKIGNQSFMILSYLLLIDIALNGFGVRWLPYPTNVFILMLASMAYYLVRIISANAFLGPGITARRTGIKAIAITIISAVAAYISASQLLKNNVRLQTEGVDDYGAYILFALSCLIIILVIIISIITSIRNKNQK